MAGAGSERSLPAKATWPIPIGLVSLFYGLLYALAYTRVPSGAADGIPAIANLAIPFCLVVGAYGTIARRPWGAALLLAGSSIAVVKCLGALAVSVQFIGGLQPVGAVLAILTMMLLTVAWPLFLIFWLRRLSVRRHIEEHWAKRAA